jgi:hypothetical protein
MPPITLSHQSERAHDGLAALATISRVTEAAGEAARSALSGASAVGFVATHTEIAQSVIRWQTRNEKNVRILSKVSLETTGRKRS